MSLMNNALRQYLEKIVSVFINDNLIYSKDEKEHKENLQMILQILRGHHIYEDIKCQVFKESLGHS